MLPGIGRLISGRSSRYLTQATVMLCIVTILAAGTMSFVERQFHQESQTFLQNPNVHYIDVTGAGRSDSSLRFADINTVDTVVRKVAGENARVVPIYSTGFGIGSGDSEKFLVGVPPEGGGLFGLDSVEDGVAYLLGANSSQMKLDIPVISVDSGGSSSASVVSWTLRTAKLPLDSPYSALSHLDADTVIVSQSTYEKVISKAFRVPWDSFRRSYDNGNPFGISAIDGMFVNVDDISEVEPTARAIEGAGFAASYTLRSFDDVPGMLRSGTNLWLIGSLIVILLCAICGFMMLRSYLVLARRDMGVLRHVGYGIDDIFRIYARRVVFLLAIACGGGMVFAVALGLVLDIDRSLIALNSGVVVALALVMGAVLLPVIRNQAKKPVVSLLKLDREFS